MSGRRSRGSSAGRAGCCIPTFFQLFNTSPPPPLLPNQTVSKGNELSFTTDKTQVKICSQKVQENVAEEKQQMATDSSTTSISSSCSSTFSSVKSDKNIFPETKSPKFPVSQTEYSTYREARVISVKKEDGKGQAMKHIDSPRPLTPPRYSCDGTVYSCKSTVTIKDLPRLSLDSRRSNYLLLENEPGSNKRPSGIVARLMGLEAFPENACQYQESLRKTSRSSDQIMQNIPSVYGVTERRNKEKSPSSVKTPENRYGQKNKASRLETEKVENGNVLLSPAAKKSSPPRRNLADKKAVAKTQKMSERASDKPASVRRTSGTVNMTKLQQKKNGVEKQERQKSQLSNSRKERRQPSKQRMESRSPTRKVKPISFEVKSRNSSNCSDSVSVQSEISINSDPMDKILDARLNDDKSTVEQPSPVSVLDATFYGEGSLSPVNKISNTIQDDERGNSIEEEWDEADNDRFRINTRPILCSRLNNQLVHELIQSNPSDHIAALYSTNPDYRYITKILLTSGFLQDSSTDQLHPPGCHLIDPNLFHVLEKTERETEHADDGQTRKTSKLTKSNSKITRMLLFDSVNDIIGRKLASSSSSIISKKLERKRLSGEKLLEEVWSEIAKLQSWGDCRLDEDEDDGSRRILSVDMMNQSNEWTGFSAEYSGLVLDIERLIFKDLIREIVNDGSTDRQRRHCRQLFKMKQFNFCSSTTV